MSVEMTYKSASAVQLLALDLLKYKLGTMGVLKHLNIDRLNALSPAMQVKTLTNVNEFLAGKDSTLYLFGNFLNAPESKHKLIALRRLNPEAVSRIINKELDNADLEGPTFEETLADPNKQERLEEEIRNAPPLVAEILREREVAEEKIAAANETISKTQPHLGPPAAVGTPQHKAQTDVAIAKSVVRLQEGKIERGNRIPAVQQHDVKVSELEAAKRAQHARHAEISIPTVVLPAPEIIAALMEARGSSSAGNYRPSSAGTSVASLHSHRSTHQRSASVGSDEGLPFQIGRFAEPNVVKEVLRARRGGGKSKGGRK